MFATGIFPTGAAADLITAITGAITDNIAPVLAVLGFAVGLKVILRMFNKSVKGRI
ncbi:MAG: hypothetical protein WCJ60_04415 [bacterium]